MRGGPGHGGLLPVSVAVTALCGPAARPPHAGPRRSPVAATAARLTVPAALCGRLRARTAPEGAATRASCPACGGEPRPRGWDTALPTPGGDRALPAASGHPLDTHRVAGRDLPSLIPSSEVLWLGFHTSAPFLFCHSGERNLRVPHPGRQKMPLPVLSLFRLRELIFPEISPDACPHNSPIPLDQGAGAALERLRHPGQVGSAFAVSATPGLPGRQGAKAEPGTTGGSASSSPWPPASAAPEGLGPPVLGYLSGLPSFLQASAGLEAREEGTGVRGLSSPLLGAGRPAEVPSCSPVCPQRGCSLLLAAGASSVCGPGYLEKEMAHKGWGQTSTRKVTPPSCGVKSGGFCLLCMSCTALTPDPDEGWQGCLVLEGR